MNHVQELGISGKIILNVFKGTGGTRLDCDNSAQDEERWLAVVSGQQTLGYIK